MASYSVSPASGSGLIGRASAPFTVTVVPDVPAPEGVPVDLFLDFDAANSGDMLTTAIASAATRGVSGGTWGYPGAVQNGAIIASPVALTHTHVTTGTKTRRVPLTCIGATHETLRGILFDITNSLDQSDYEGIKWTPFADSILGGVSLTAVMEFNASRGADTLTSIDYLTMYHGGLSAIAQYQQDNVGARIKVHSTGGESQGGNSVSVSNGVEYSITLRTNPTNSRVEMVVINNVTGALVGCSHCATSLAFSEGSALTFVQLWDYLLNGTGTVAIYGVALGIGANALLPLETITVPAPVITSLTQDSDTSLLLKWTSAGMYYRIERWTAAGGWTLLTANYVKLLPLEYADSTIVAGTEHRYRVTALVGSHESSATESDAYTPMESIGVPYLIAEDFETGVKPDTWTNSGSPNWGYTAVVLQGAKSLATVGGSTAAVAFAGKTIVEAYCMFRLITLPGSTQTLFGFRDNSEAALCLMQVTASGVVQLFTNGTSTGGVLAGTMAASTNYHVWLRFTSGGQCTLAFSTDGIRPTSGSNFVSRVTGSSGTATRLNIGTAVIVDRILVLDGVIGDNP